MRLVMRYGKQMLVVALLVGIASAIPTANLAAQSDDTAANRAREQAEQLQQRAGDHVASR